MSKSKNVIEWRKRTKAKIVESMGGKCSSCGYSTCADALEMHHLIPSEKSFSFGNMRANPKAWKTIVDELKKCVMLCANCHREVEAGIKQIEVKQYFIEAYEDTKFFTRSKMRYTEKMCLFCNEFFLPTSGTQKICSPLCR